VKIQIKSAKNLQAKTDCLIVALKPLKKLGSQQTDLNNATSKSIDKLQAAELFSATEGQIAIVPVPDGIAAKTLVLIGTGDSKKLDIESTRDVLTKLAKKLKTLGINEATFDLDALVAKSDIDTVSRHLCEAVGDSQYQYIKEPKSVRGAKPNKDFKATLWVGDRKLIGAAKKVRPLSQTKSKSVIRKRHGRIRHGLTAFG